MPRDLDTKNQTTTRSHPTVSCASDDAELLCFVPYLLNSGLGFSRFDCSVVGLGACGFRG